MIISGGRNVSEGILFYKLVTSVTCLQTCQSELGVTIATGVSSWTDLKAGLNYTQGTGGQQPLVIQPNTAGLNGHPCIRFDGVNDTLTSSLNRPTPSAGTPTFLWFVMRQNAWTSGQRYFGGHSANNSMILFANPSTPNIEGFNATASGANAGADIGSWVRGEARWAAGASDYVKLGNVSPAPGSMGGQTAATGRDIGSSAGVQFASMDIAAIAYFSGIPSGAELTLLNSACIAKYGNKVKVA